MAKSATTRPSAPTISPDTRTETPEKLTEDELKAIRTLVDSIPGVKLDLYSDPWVLNYKDRPIGIITTGTDSYGKHVKFDSTDADGKPIKAKTSLAPLGKVQPDILFADLSKAIEHAVKEIDDTDSTTEEERVMPALDEQAQEGNYIPLEEAKEKMRGHDLKMLEAVEQWLNDLPIDDLHKSCRLNLDGSLDYIDIYNNDWRGMKLTAGKMDDGQRTMTQIGYYIEGWKNVGTELELNEPFLESEDDVKYKIKYFFGIEEPPPPPTIEEEDTTTEEPETPKKSPEEIHQFVLGSVLNYESIVRSCQGDEWKNSNINKARGLGMSIADYTADQIKIYEEDLALLNANKIKIDNDVYDLDTDNESQVGLVQAITTHFNTIIDAYKGLGEIKKEELGSLIATRQQESWDDMDEIIYALREADSCAEEFRKTKIYKANVEPGMPLEEVIKKCIKYNKSAMDEMKRWTEASASTEGLKVIGEGGEDESVRLTNEQIHILLAGISQRSVASARLNEIIDKIREEGEAKTTITETTETRVKPDYVKSIESIENVECKESQVVIGGWEIVIPNVSPNMCIYKMNNEFRLQDKNTLFTERISFLNEEDLIEAIKEISEGKKFSEVMNRIKKEKDKDQTNQTKKPEADEIMKEKEEILNYLKGELGPDTDIIDTTTGNPFLKWELVKGDDKLGAISFGKEKNNTYYMTFYDYENRSPITRTFPRKDSLVEAIKYVLNGGKFEDYKIE